MAHRFTDDGVVLPDEAEAPPLDAARSALIVAGAQAELLRRRAAAGTCDRAYLDAAIGVVRAALDRAVDAAAALDDGSNRERAVAIGAHQTHVTSAATELHGA